MKAVGDVLSDQIITDFIAAGDFTILADESTDEADCSQMSIFVHFIDAFDKLVERFLVAVNLKTSKNAFDLHKLIMKHLESKNRDSSCICFSGHDGTNVMSREQKCLKRLVRHVAPYSEYLNCRIPRLALCKPRIFTKKLLKLDRVLLSLWKTFKYNSIKQAIYEQAQEASNLKPLNVLKTCMTR